MRTFGTITLCFILLAQADLAIAQNSSQNETTVPDNPQVDCAGFVSLTKDLQDYRAKRLITMDEFVELADKNAALILDTRSVQAFQSGHIRGAINLPFSDFTEDKLRAVLGDKNRPILIYCNNNFRDNIFPVARKAAPLALNIPTFINLYGYGYQNIYELNDIVPMTDPRLDWVDTSVEADI